MNQLRFFLAGQSRLAVFAAAVVLFLVTMSVALVPIRADNDAWWHVKSGWYIAEHGLPRLDVFSYTAADREWHNHEWLTQLAMWRIFEFGDARTLGGWRAVILAKSLTIGACYLVLFVLARRITGNTWVALLVALLAMDASRRTFHPRPPVLSNLLLALELLLLIGAGQKWWRTRWLAILPPAFALWSNLHGAWMAGIVVLAAFAGQDMYAALLHRWHEKSPAPFKTQLMEASAPNQILHWRWWALLFPLCVAATLLNPSGFELYKLPARVMSDTALVSSLGELQPPAWFFFPLLKFTLILTALLIVVLLAVSFSRRRLVLPLYPAEWALYLFFLYQGVNHVRHLLLFGVMLVPLTARLFRALWDDRNWLAAEAHALARKQLVPSISVLTVSLLFAGAVLRNWPEGQTYPLRNRLFFAIEEGYIRKAFPAEAADFIEMVEFEGRMFNENYYAGYLIWRFSPEQHKVFSDSRFDIFGGEIWRQEIIVATAFEPEANESIPSWREVLERWDVNWMLIHPEKPIAEKLQSGTQGWAVVADWSRFPQAAQWQIWVRDIPENEELIRRARHTFRRQTGVLLQ